jgi:hypothetical protein
MSDEVMTAKDIRNTADLISQAFESVKGISINPEQKKTIAIPDQEQGSDPITQTERIFMWFMFKLMENAPTDRPIIQSDYEEMSIMAKALTEVSIRRIKELETDVNS